MHIEDWDHWIQRIDEIDLSPLEKEKTRESFKIIQKVLNSSVPLLFEQRHPILSNLINTAPWTRRWFIQLANSFQLIQQHTNYEENLRKIRMPNLYLEALSELDVAVTFIEAGFDVEFYKKIESINKEPDLKITNPDTNEEFFVEVTRLGSSDQAKDSYRTFDTISKTIFTNSFRNGKYLHYSGNIYKYLSEPNLKRVLEKLNKIIEQAYNSGFEDLIETGVVELAFALEEKKDFLNQWEKEHNIESGTLTGPSYDSDETHRLGQKIRTKQNQLPKELLNILVIKDEASFMIFKRDLKEEIGRLEEYVYEHDHLAFCVIFSSYLGGTRNEKITTIGEHFKLEKSTNIQTRETLFLVNKFIINKTFTPNSASKIRNAFLQNRIFLA